jgi:hypothetical protein
VLLLERPSRSILPAQMRQRIGLRAGASRDRPAQMIRVAAMVSIIMSRGRELGVAREVRVDWSAAYSWAE